nr:hypothetical protein [Actinoplanes lichenicola]
MARAATIESCRSHTSPWTIGGSASSGNDASARYTTIGTCAPQNAPSSAPHQLDATDRWVATKTHTEHDFTAARNCSRNDAPALISEGRQ